MPRRKNKELITENNLDSLVDKFKRVFREEDLNVPPAWFLPTGNLAFDYIISGRVDGAGGYPSGVTEIFGDPSSGKSVLLAKAIAEAQKLGIPTILADAEGRWDGDFAKLHGVDKDKMLPPFYPETVEEWAIKSSELLDVLGESQRLLLILDSLGILSTIKEIEDVEGGDIKADQGRKAQKIKAAMRVLRYKVRKTGSVLLVSNHVIANPGSYSHKKLTPGGGGVPFQSNVRVELSEPTILSIPGKDRPIGVELHIRVAKNSIAPPFGEASLNLFWNRGISKYSGLLKLALDLGILTKSGAWNYYGEIAFQSGDFEKVLEEHPEILQHESWKKPYWL